MDRMRSLLERFPWIWALIGIVLMWILIGVFTKVFSVSTLVVNASLACYLAIVSLGQMFPISSGEGGIDLSIPYVITLTAFVSMGLINGKNSEIIVGLIAALAIGLVVGLVNALAIVVFDIPPIIATMGTGFIVNTGVLLYSGVFSSFSTSPFMSHVVDSKLLGIPLIIFLTIILGVAVTLVFQRTVFGRKLLAVGQNRRAASIAGVKVQRTIIFTYLISGVLASIGGVLIASHVHGAFLGMGQPYLLESVGAVVIGGTLISGGRSTVPGTLLGALFLTLVVTLMEVTHMAIGGQDIVEGLIIILVLIAATGNTSKRKRLHRQRT